MMKCFLNAVGFIGYLIFISCIAPLICLAVLFGVVNVFRTTGVPAGLLSIVVVCVIGRIVICVFEEP
jgi:hypothetical protein